MLVAMDIPAAAAGPWIALGVVLAVVLLGLVGLGAGLLARRPPAGAVPTPAEQPHGDPPDHPREHGHDDLAAFLEHPPGSSGHRGTTVAGWATLSAPAPMTGRLPQPAAAPASPPGPSRQVLVALATAALLLLGAAAAVATGLADRDTGPSTATPSPTSAPTGRPLDAEEVEVRLTFGGMVLEEHAVGVTATYPELHLTGNRAHVELPTYNCLAAEAPADPAAAGCRRSVPEYADLVAPDLEVTRTDDGLTITGRFPTLTRPNGTAPAATGRAYELRVTVVHGDRPEDGWLPARGVLRLGAYETATTGTDAAAGVNVLRYGDRQPPR